MTKVRWVSWETWYAYWLSRIDTPRYGCTSLGKYNIWDPVEKLYLAVHPEDVPPDVELSEDSQ